MNLVLVDGRHWWAPDSRPMTLAVAIDKEADYLPAVREKLVRLMQASGSFSDVLGLVSWVMEPQGLTVAATNDPEHLADQVLVTAGVGEMVRAGAPWMSPAAADDDAVAAVQSQAELSLSNLV